MLNVELPSEKLLEVLEYFSEPLSSTDNYVNEWLSTGWTGLFNLDLVLSYAIKEGASDIHIVGNQEICFTILGDIVKKSDIQIPNEDIMTDLVNGILSNLAFSTYVRDKEYDTSYTIMHGPYKDRRFRVNIGRSFDIDQMTFRTINDYIPTPKDLLIDDEYLEVFENTSGVVLVCGATGSGKSTTLASIIRDIQTTKQKKIITVEKPIEYIYPKDGSSLIVQRSIPEDCVNFSYGLTSAMRSAPNIILIGEVRNKEEVDELLRASETGHLSISTMHTTNNVTTLNRIRSLYTGEEQKRVLNTLGDNLRSILNQVLVKSIDGKSRFAVREILNVDYKIRELIIKDDMVSIRKIQEKNEETLEHKLVEVYLKGLCTKKEAKSKAPDRAYFDYILGDRKPKREDTKSIEDTKKEEEIDFLKELEY